MDQWEQTLCSLSCAKHRPVCTYCIKPQVSEQCLHEDLSQVCVRVGCCGTVCGVWRGREACTRRKHLGSISRRAVAQKRGHMGVVLKAGQYNVQLHPLWHRHTHLVRLFQHVIFEQNQTAALNIKLVGIVGSNWGQHQVRYQMLISFRVQYFPRNKAKVRPVSKFGQWEKLTSAEVITAFYTSRSHLCASWFPFLVRFISSFFHC